jgi:hypothetical protein
MNRPILVMWQNEMLYVTHIVSYGFQDRPGFYVFGKVNTATGYLNQLTCWIIKTFRCILWNLAIRYQVHKSHLVVLIIIQINTFCILTVYLLNIRFTVIISFTFGNPGLLKGFYQNSGGIRLKTFPVLCVLLCFLYIFYFILTFIGVFTELIYLLNSKLLLTCFHPFFCFYLLDEFLLKPTVNSTIFHIWAAAFLCEIYR